MSTAFHYKGWRTCKTAGFAFSTSRNSQRLPTELFEHNGPVDHLGGQGNWPLFDEGSLTSETYKSLLRYYLLPKLASYPFDLRFQPHESSRRHTSPVRQYLEQRLPNREMERKGPISWPVGCPEFIRATLRIEDTLKRVYSAS